MKICLTYLAIMLNFCSCISYREKYRHMKAQTCLAIAAVGLLAMLYFRLTAKGGVFQIFSPGERDFSHSFTINFSNGNLYKGNALTIYGLFTIMLQWVHSHTTGLGIKLYHNLCSNPDTAKHFAGNISRHLYYVGLSLSVKWRQIISAASQDCWAEWCFNGGEIWTDVTKHAHSVSMFLTSNKPFSLELSLQQTLRKAT